MEKTALLFCFTLLLLSCKPQTEKNRFDEIEGSPAANLTPDLTNKSIQAIFQDSGGNYWFASKDNGVFQYDGSTLKQFTETDGLCSNTILGIQEDRAGVLYFDTPKGVGRYDGSLFRTLEWTRQEKEWEAGRDDLWFTMGWSHNGPFRFNGEELVHMPFPKNPMETDFKKKNPNASYNPYGVYSIYKDSRGILWFGTSNLGIYVFDGHSLGWMYEDHLTTTPQGGAFGIRSIIEDQDGYLWICNPSFKYRITGSILPDTDNLQMIPYIRERGIEDPLSKELYFIAMARGLDNNLWMLTYQDGVWKYDGTELLQYPLKKNSGNLALLTVYKDSSGSLWVGTEKSGVLKMQGESFEPFTPENSR